ncbi:MAG: GvpL/GvpF family gas vesicle protein [Thermoleophilia bacterium]|nr:GvpL/GvpF family gas vesicle protein [Thermoleophilia bacterium]
MGDANGGSGTYVYGVAPAGSPLALAGRGLADQPVYAVETARLRAIASAAPAGLVEATRENLGAHLRVVREAREAGTVVPFRFGLVMPDDEAVRAELLTANADALEAVLAELDGRWEMTVRALYDEDALLREAVDGRRDVARLREEVRRLPEDAGYFARIRLGEAVAAAIGALRERDAGLVVDRLAPLAVDVRTARDQPERVAVKASFLVDEDRLGEFDAALEALATELAPRIRFKAVGPLPAHSFADVSLTAGSVA